MLARLYCAAIPENVGGEVGERVRQRYLRSPLYRRASAYGRVLNEVVRQQAWLAERERKRAEGET